MLTGLGNYRAGALPPVRSGLALSRQGVTVTAFGPDPDGAGTLLRLWELAGAGGECVVTLPAGMRVRAAQPVHLRGERTGPPIPIVDGKFSFMLSAYAPASFVLAPELPVTPPEP